MDSNQRFDVSRLKECVVQRLIQAGLPLDIARLEANIMLEADMHGVPSHGIRMLPSLLKAINTGQIFAAAKPSTLREFGAISLVDCGNGPGRYSAAMAMDMAVNQAQKFGVGVCLAKNTSHWGRAHAYASRAALKGCIGICTTNAIPTMAAFGANTRVLGNNPLAIGVPAMDAGEPIVLDMAMSQAAMGKVATLQREGKSNTEYLGFDNKGHPSTNPAAILGGAVAPMGGHKGAGLSFMIELLTAALSGAQFCYQLVQGGPNPVDSNASKIFIALSVGAFCEPEDYKSKVSQIIEYLKTETSDFKWPAERGWQENKNSLRLGLPVHIEIEKELLRAGLDISLCRL